MKRLFLLLLIIAWGSGSLRADPKPLDIAPGTYLLITHLTPAAERPKDEIGVTKVSVSRDSDGKLLLAFPAWPKEMNGAMRPSEIVIVENKAGLSLFQFASTLEHITKGREQVGCYADVYVGHRSESGVLEGKVTEIYGEGNPRGGVFQLYPIAAP